MNGAEAQEAFDMIGSMLDARFEMWNEVLKSLPSWGDEVDVQVQL